MASLNPNLHGPNFNLIHMGGACHNPNKTNVMTNFKTFPYGYLVAEWLERLTSERVIGGSNPVNGIIFCLA